MVELRRRRRKYREKRQDDSQQVKAAFKAPSIYRPVYVDEAYARLAHSISTDRPFLERLTQFWSNHFAVSIDKVAVLGLAGAMEREAIRPRVTGSFTDLLLAVEKHPAMLLYLDNQLSIGPNSPRRQTGRAPRQQAQGGHQREPRARDSRAAHPGRERRLHPGGRHHVRTRHLGLVHRRR